MQLISLTPLVVLTLHLPAIIAKGTDSQSPIASHPKSTTSSTTTSSATTCQQSGCPDGYGCTEINTCVLACVKGVCPENQHCHEGLCYHTFDVEAKPSCSGGETWVPGDGCQPVTIHPIRVACSAGELWVDGIGCQPISVEPLQPNNGLDCEIQACPEGSLCQSGLCVRPVFGDPCPFGEIWTDGSCVPIVSNPPALQHENSALPKAAKTVAVAIEATCHLNLDGTARCCSKTGGVCVTGQVEKGDQHVVIPITDEL